MSDEKVKAFPKNEEDAAVRAPLRVSQPEQVLNDDPSSDDILAAPDLTVKKVEVPEWNAVVRLRVLTAGEALKLQSILNAPQKSNSAMLHVVMMCAVRKDGSPLFTETQINRLKEKSLKVLLRLQREALELNDLLPDKDKADKVQEEVKNV